MTWEMPRDTMVDFFDDLAVQRGEFLVYDDGYRTWSRTYAEVAHAARTFAHQLREHGITQGEKIVFWSENRPEWVAALWGCLLEGVVAVPVDYHSSAEFAGRIAGIVQARAVLVGDVVDANALRAEAPNWSLSDVGRTPWSAADPLVGLLGRAQQPDEGVRRGPGGPPHQAHPDELA